MGEDKIEIRSEKVRQIIGEVPSVIVRCGITVITIVILALLAWAYFIPYPETVDVEVRMTKAHETTITIPYRYVNIVEVGMTAIVEFDGYDMETYGTANGKITAISHIPQQTAMGSTFTAQIKITDCKYELVNGMTGRASILVSNESVLQIITKRMANIV